jgi:competence protein ComEC
MDDARIRMRLLVLMVLVAGGVLVWLWPPENSVLMGAVGTSNEGLLLVHFLDVGQGDAIFIESPTGVQVLIDGGPDAGVLHELSKVMSFFDRSIDLVMATHPDSDHVGGLSDVLMRYRVGAVLLTENEGDSPAADAFTEAVASEGVTRTYARRGQEYDLGGGVVLDVLFPETNPKDMESNTSSIVVQLRYGETEVMLTGDSPKSIEEYLVLVEGDALQSDILKVGHHGSRTSTSELFLATVDPTYAVISAEKDSRYGHPHVEVTDALFNAGVKTQNTAEAGTITFLSDGRTIVSQ